VNSTQVIKNYHSSVIKTLITSATEDM